MVYLSKITEHTGQSLLISDCEKYEFLIKIWIAGTKSWSAIVIDED